MIMEEASQNAITSIEESRSKTNTRQSHLDLYNSQGRHTTTSGTDGLNSMVYNMLALHHSMQREEDLRLTARHRFNPNASLFILDQKEEDTDKSQKKLLGQTMSHFNMKSSPHNKRINSPRRKHPTCPMAKADGIIKG